MKLVQVLEKFKMAPDFAANIAHWHTISPREGEYVDFPGTVDKRLVEALSGAGIRRLFSHQMEAFKAANNGQDVVVVTPTASGKSLCYNLPVMNYLMSLPVSHQGAFSRPVGRTLRPGRGRGS
jgi:DEAD/DEAH box helicase domain-containing protein